MKIRHKIWKRPITIILALAMIFLLASCGSQTEKEIGPIKIASKPMTEQYILTEMLKILIEENTEYEVEITKGIGGGTSNIHPAMEKGEFDLYPEYTSTGWMMVLDKENSDISDKEMFAELKKEYEEKYDMTWLGIYGFNNTFAVAVSKETADKYDLKSSSDLAPFSGDLVFGGNPDYIERVDGFSALCKEYNYDFKDVKDIDIGLKYKALSQGDIDVTDAYTTDAWLSHDNVVTLKDDKNFHVNYFCSTVVRLDSLKKYDGLEESLALMNNLLTDKEMSELNYKVEVDNMDEATVARDYLISKGLVDK